MVSSLVYLDALEISVLLIRNLIAQSLLHAVYLIISL